MTTHTTHTITVRPKVELLSDEWRALHVIAATRSTSVQRVIGDIIGRSKLVRDEVARLQS